ncbi:MAG: hypothetical protein QOI12_229 [Alphaproteobacteria bacterium]|jgi:sporulation protein YlmC with PRC-barrel domain|nr:hypothetical protein [Alphaproteobacteria bacterium]
MLKRLMIATATAALLTGSAVAQDTPRNAAPGAAPMAKANFITQQTADQWLASKFKGTDVIGANNEKIGDVNDILFEKDGKVVAYVIGVGGFLGIGAKDVALSPTSFQVKPANDRENLKLVLAMTKDELKNAPEFKPLREPATTGMAPRDRAPATPDRGPATPPAQR